MALALAIGSRYILAPGLVKGAGMRFAGWIAAIVVLALAASWFGGQEIARRAQAALAEMAQMDRARVGSVSAAGFPLRVGVDFRDLALLDGPQVETPRLVATAPLWNPLDWSGDVSLPMAVTLNGMRFDVTGTQAGGGLRAGYASGWPVRAARIAISDPAATYEAAEIPSLAARDLRLAAVQEGAGAYRIDAGVDALTLPPGLAASLTPNAKFSDTIETISAQGLVTFSTPFTLSPQPAAPEITALTIDTLRLVWDGHEIGLSGSLTVAPDGRPEGTLNLRLHDWEDWLEFAQGAFNIDRRAMPVLTILGNTLSQGTGDGSIVAPLTFRNGEMALGPVPLGPAPLLR
ncbi:DUF2125 domain-containing protein [Sinirhodobacter populi]|nr:DUF2125 domain-containing protein [Sinirhodobacter populi]